jgi:hypothetical protein
MPKKALPIALPVEGGEEADQKGEIAGEVPAQPWQEQRAGDGSDADAGEQQAIGAGAEPEVRPRHRRQAAPRSRWRRRCTRRRAPGRYAAPGCWRRSDCPHRPEGQVA